MSSTLENFVKILEADTAQDTALRLATPFTKMHNLGGSIVDFGADTVTHEMYKGSRKVAPLVSRRDAPGGTNVDASIIRPGTVGANDYLEALISQSFEIPAYTLNRRITGESPYIQGSEADIKNMRRQILTMRAAKDAVRRIMTRDELLAKQAYFDGEMALGDRVDGSLKLVYPRSTVLKNRTVSTSWATAASATPWKDYGDAQRKIKELSQVETGGLWHSFLSSAAMSNLRAIYRAQRSGDSASIDFFQSSFNPEEAVPSELAYLIDNGCEYNGWIRTSYSNARMYLFTLPEGYDASTTEGTETYTDWISGNTVSVGLSGAGMFKAYYGPGILEIPQNNVVEAAIGRVGVPNLGDLGALTLGNSGIPTESMILNVYDLGKNQGFGGSIEHGPLFAPKWADTVATIATTTTA